MRPLIRSSYAVFPLSTIRRRNCSALLLQGPTQILSSWQQIDISPNLIWSQLGISPGCWLSNTITHICPARLGIIFPDCLNLPQRACCTTYHGAQHSWINVKKTSRVCYCSLQWWPMYKRSSSWCLYALITGRLCFVTKYFEEDWMWSQS